MAKIMQCFLSNVLFQNVKRFYRFSVNVKFWNRLISVGRFGLLYEMLTLINAMNLSQCLIHRANNLLIQITVTPSGPASDLNVPVEIVIGSIPLASIAQQHGLVLPQAPPAQGTSVGLYNDARMPAALRKRLLLNTFEV